MHRAGLPGQWQGANRLRGATDHDEHQPRYSTVHCGRSVIGHVNEPLWSTARDVRDASDQVSRYGAQTAELARVIRASAPASSPVFLGAPTLAVPVELIKRVCSLLVAIIGEVWPGVVCCAGRACAELCRPWVLVESSRRSVARSAAWLNGRRKAPPSPRQFTAALHPTI